MKNKSRGVITHHMHSYHVVTERIDVVPSLTTSLLIMTNFTITIFIKLPMLGSLYMEDT